MTILLWLRNDINLKWYSNLTFVALFTSIVFSAYGIYKEGILARQLILYWPIFTNQTINIYFAPYSRDIAFWALFFLLFYWKKFKYLTIPLITLAFGFDEMFFQVSFYTDTLGHLFFNDFFPLALTFFIIGFFFVRKNITWKYPESKYFALIGYPIFIILWTLMGNPVILNPIKQTITVSNWIWEEWYQIFYLTLIFLTVDKKHNIGNNK